MKKFWILGLLLVVLIASPASAKKWTCFFVDQEEDIDPGPDTVLGFILDPGGPNETAIPTSNVVIVKTVGANSMFIYTTQNLSIANKAYQMAEFRGFGYVDMVMRIAQGLGSGTLNEIEYITGAHWYTGGEWHFGNIKDWDSAGNPEPVWFGRYRGILGVEIQ